MPNYQVHLSMPDKVYNWLVSSVAIYIAQDMVPHRQPFKKYLLE